MHNTQGSVSATNKFDAAHKIHSQGNGKVCTYGFLLRHDVEWGRATYGNIPKSRVGTNAFHAEAWVCASDSQLQLRCAFSGKPKRKRISRPGSRRLSAVLFTDERRLPLPARFATAKTAMQLKFGRCPIHTRLIFDPCSVRVRFVPDRARSVSDQYPSPRMKANQYPIDLTNECDDAIRP